MTRAELVEMLQVERYLPLPPTPKPGQTYDDPRDQYARRTALDEAVQEFDQKHRDAAPPMVRKGMILVPAAAA